MARRRFEPRQSDEAASDIGRRRRARRTADPAGSRPVSSDSTDHRQDGSCRDAQPAGCNPVAPTHDCERNLFLRARTQVATDLESSPASRCDSYALRNGPSASSTAGAATDGTLGRRDGTAVRRLQRGRAIDRPAAAERPDLVAQSAAAGRAASIALTGFARAVQLQDDGDRRARTELSTQLPQLRVDMHAIAVAPPGPAKRFAEFFVMAKLPGLRTDLDEYVRPLGTLADFQGYWVDWLILPRGAGTGPGENPRAAGYLRDSYWYGDDESRADFTCLGECGAGAFPLHLPGFVAAKQDAAVAERRFWLPA